MNDYGTLLDPTTARFERLLPGPIERVWDYLTVGEQKAKWLAGGDIEPKVGGKVVLHFHHKTLSPHPDVAPPEAHKEMPEEVTGGGTVTRWDPPRVLAHTWEFEDEQTEVTYELQPVGDRVRLTLTHVRLEPTPMLIGVSAGWHTHLAILEDVLAGVAPQPFWKVYSRLEQEYGQRIAPGA